MVVIASHMLGMIMLDVYLWPWIVHFLMLVLNVRLNVLSVNTLVATKLTSVHTKCHDLLCSAHIVHWFLLLMGRTCVT